MISKSPRTITLFIQSLVEGGAERVIVNLAREFVNRDLKVDLVTAKNAQGVYQSHLPSEVRIIELKAKIVPLSLPSMVRYLRQEKPIALLSSMHYSNEVAILAKRLSGVSTRVVVSEHSILSMYATYQITERFTPLLAKIFYRWSDGIVAVSQGVAKDIVRLTGLPLQDIQVIYNPVIPPDLSRLVKETVDHPWFASQDIPVILGVGRLVKEKDFPTLIHAFAQVRRVRKARLVILGTGPEKLNLQALVKELGLEADVDIPGCFVQNVYAYMARAEVFVLSSAFEGLGNVLAEAMAVGTSVISTNCPSGPAEILDNGKYGILIPVGDSKALTEAILNVLSSESKTKSVDQGWLEQFTLEKVADKYLEVLNVPQ